MNARTLEIRGRRRFDQMSISEPSQFRVRRAPAIDASLVLHDPSVSLYCLDLKKREALFVETPASVDLTRAAFYYQAQFAEAKRLIVVSLEQLRELAQAKDLRPRRVVAIHSVGRCGSTLLSKMFASVDQCMSLSEPDVYAQLLFSNYDDELVSELLDSSTRLYFNPRDPDRTTHLVLKFRSFCIELAEPIYQTVQPQTTLFLYRDAERVVQSGMRAFRQWGTPLHAMDLGHRLWITRPVLAWLLGRNLEIGRRLFPWLHHFSSRRLASLGAVGMLAIAWLSAMDRYLSLRRLGLPIEALRYDDLVREPNSMMSKLLDRCDLPSHQLPSALEAMRADSQAESVVARHRTRAFELSARDRRTIRELISEHPVIDAVDYELPGTIRP